MFINHRLPVFITDTHKCSYLENRDARTAFVDPSIPITKNLASALNLQGFRRSGRYLYKTSCPACNACQPLRVKVDGFQPNKTQRRTLKKNADLTVRIMNPAEITTSSDETYYALYQNYIEQRHTNGDMYPPSREQFDSFVGELYDFSRIIEFRLGDQLVMVSLCDQLSDGLSAIYTFFDPAMEKRSPGAYAILWQIQYCARENLPFLYLGFWVAECSKMNYKSCYRPNEIYTAGKWQPGQPDNGWRSY